ncbi:MAG: DUF1318 domain-containing protein [Verrucomicrobiae bacterium]|nr:DUF1318 domain-containing protein [Verrucomicrobiae bacterium]
MENGNRRMQAGGQGMAAWIVCGVLGVGVSSCAPTVKLNTPEPIKVDINVRVDVFEKERPRTASADSKVRNISNAEIAAIQRHRNNEGQIWAMKNDGAAVEGENGYLETRPRSGWDPVYVAKLVAEENQDRGVFYAVEARDSKRPLSVIEQEAGRRLREEAYAGGKKAPAAK